MGAMIFRKGSSLCISKELKFSQCCFLKMTIIKILLSMIFEIEIGYILLRLFTEKTQNNIFQGQQ